MLEYFSHNIIKNVVAGFGTLFNDIHVARYDSANAEVRRIKVPMAYGPKQKFIVKLEGESSEDLIRNVGLYLPRISYEMTNISYDPSRKLPSTRKLVMAADVEGSLQNRFERVPYTLNFDLNIMTKNTDDAFQIIEQILPYFGPDFTITFAQFPVDPKIDVPITINNISFDEQYTGTFEERKVCVATISFKAQIQLYGPVHTSKVILRAQANIGDLDSYFTSGVTGTPRGFMIDTFTVTGSTFASIVHTVTGGATAGSIGATGTIDTVITEWGA